VSDGDARHPRYGGRLGRRVAAVDSGELPDGVEVVEGDATSLGSVRSLAESADVLVSTVGGPDKSLYLQVARTFVAPSRQGGDSHPGSSTAAPEAASSTEPAPASSTRRAFRRRYGTRCSARQPRSTTTGAPQTSTGGPQGARRGSMTIFLAGPKLGCAGRCLRAVRGLRRRG